MKYDYVMDKINKDFDGVSWEWKGKTAIRDLKSICPKCQYELDIKFNETMIVISPPPTKGLRITPAYVSYFCPNCDFTTPTTIDDVKNPKDLRKAALKEFEHRQRLMVRRTSKKNK